MTDVVARSSDAPHFPPGAAVVVGGSGGIGREICRRLAEHGTDVALTYRSNRTAGEQAAADVEQRGRRALAAPLDLSDADAVMRFLDEAATTFAGIHTLVYAVGAPISMVYAAEVDLAEWQSTIEGDLTGFFTVSKAALPHLRAARGSIVAVTSAGLVRHPPKDVLSTVPKAGIEALVRAIAREEGRNGVRANSVALGVIDAGHFERAKRELSDEFVAAIAQNTAVRRIGTAREAADAVVFLASSASGYTTGTSLTVDGGYSV